MQHVQIHGHDIAYRGGGEGPVVLLIHGMAGSSATWDAVIPRLSEHYTVIAPDLPGHGQSEKPANADYSLGAFASMLRDLLLSLGHRRATIVGQSLGGGVAMQFAYQFPERCERLVLVGSGGLGREVTMLLRLLTLPGSDYVLPLFCSSVTRDAGRSVRGLLKRVGLRPNPMAAEIWASFDSLADPQTRAAFMRTLRSVVDLGGQQVSAADRLPLAAEIPTLVMWGDRDPIIPHHHAEAAAAAIPSCRVEIFERVGHFPHCEAPERFIEVFNDFVRTTDPAAVSEDRYLELLAT